MFSSVHVRSTLIGEKVFPDGKTEGFKKINLAALTTLRKRRFAADGQPLRLAGEPLPLFASQTEEDIATFPAFNYDSQLHCP